MTLASVDLGSNTALLLIARYDAARDRLETLANRYRIPRLARGLRVGGDLAEDRVAETISILRDYLALAREYQCVETIVVGAAAFRHARNARDVIERIRQETGLEIRVLTGEEEAALGYRGAQLEAPGDFAKATIDIGGGSTEIALGVGAEPRELVTTPLGVVRLREEHIRAFPASEAALEAIGKEIRDTLRRVLPRSSAPELVIGMGGAPATLLAIAENTSLDETAIDGKRLSVAAIRRTLGELARQTPEELRDRYGELMEGRADVIVVGGMILLEATLALGAEEIATTTKGVRHGAALERARRRSGYDF
jgi:exopolyphosphatase/guanosine-5'-triphosphate,3'-diphosphate pyrophosphatase